jgi:hypothetical protein
MPKFSSPENQGLGVSTHYRLYLLRAGPGNLNSEIDGFSAQ